MAILPLILNGEYMEIQRSKYLSALIARRHNGFVKVITGIRRAGKSYLMNTLFYRYLISDGIDSKHIIRFAFDSADDLASIGENIEAFSIRKVNPMKFMDHIKKTMTDDGMYYLLLDEVQRLESFEAVLNGYLRKSNIDIYVTGSNSKFLSSDILTEFEGRGDEIHVFPLVFSEFFSAGDSSPEEAFDDYMTYGGLPAIVLMKTEEQKASYLEAQMKRVYLKDIIARYNLDPDSEISELVEVLASGISCLTNPTKLSNTFKSARKSSLSVATIAKYISYLQDAFIINKAQQYDIKGKRYIATPFKIYFEDVGLRNALLNFRQVEPTHLMENIIFNELRYRGYRVDVGVVEYREKDNEGKDRRKRLEIDFVANQGSKRYYIQSAYAIPDETKWRQETNSFDKTHDSFKKLVIVDRYQKPKRTEKGYVTMGLTEFLLDPNSLEA